MKRALAFAVVTLLVGIVGLGQISGTWSGKIDLLPSVGLDNTSLELKYTIAGFEFTSTSKFDSSGFISQEFDVTGTIGPVNVEASMSFLPSGEKVLKDIKYTLDDITHVTPPAGVSSPWSFTGQDEKWVISGPTYLSSSLDLSMDFAGVSLDLAITHETNKVITFDEICDALEYYEVWHYSYTEQTTSDSFTETVDIVDRDWYLGSGTCCYGKYFVNGLPEMVLNKVKIEEYEGTPAAVVNTTTLSGPFDVFGYNASPLTITLSDAAKDYILYYILEVLISEEGWGGTSIVFAVKGAYTPAAGDIVVWLDPDDLSIEFLLPDYMTYTFTAEADPFKAEIVFDDVSTGIQFKEATISLSDVSLCCGLTYDAEFHFTKCKGFDYAKFTIDNLFSLCCGISFSASVKFGVDYKEVSITPSWQGIKNCVTVYGDVQWEDNKLSGWELYAWKIYCEFAECNKLTIVTALDPAWYNDNVEKVFEDNEFEYIKIETCGAGCCGGNWSLSLQTFFQPSGSLFGITRTDIEASVPVMSNLSLSISMEVPDTSLSIGWSFSF